ncbi:MAG TPA: hypothetical protein VMW52_06375 [Phycisphaerae bacterium]|nr:hypothetical protein [Phycisphaerae bacterium]
MAESLSARRPSARDMRARRTAANTRTIREERGHLQLGIAAKVCRRCATKGEWEFLKTNGRIRHLKCRVCGFLAKFIL